MPTMRQRLQGFLNPKVDMPKPIKGDRPQLPFQAAFADSQASAQLAEMVTAATNNQQGGEPAAWVSDTYAPGWPIQPMVRPVDPDIPREIDFPIAANVSIQPRTHYGLMPFAALRDAYQTLPEITLAVHTVTREMQAFMPQLVGVTDGKPVTDHPFDWLVKFPDRRTPWTVWVTRFLESVQVFDAGAVFIETDESRMLQGLRYVDGSTLFCLIDNNGSTPTPPDPAFLQIIKGTVFGKYTANDIWYRPRYRRHDAPYGMSPIEMVWPWVLMLANIEGFELAHYRTGNMPEGVAEAPDGWTLQQIAVYENLLNARMSSGPAERNRWRIVPAGFNFTALKRGEDFPRDLYEQARENVLLSFGIPPSEFGQTPGLGLGGKGYMDAMQSALYRNCLLPLATYVEGFMNYVLQRFAISDVKFKMGLQVEDIDPQRRQEQIIGKRNQGLLTFNQALSAMGEETIPGGDVRIMLLGNQVIRLDDFLSGKSDNLKPDANQPDTEEVDLEKHCGICPEDEAVIGAPVASDSTVITLDNSRNGAKLMSVQTGPNTTQRVVWKAASAEHSELVGKVGGFQYLREVAVYRLDRSLDLRLVPVAWLSRVNNEPGAMIFHTDNQAERRPAFDYAQLYAERAAVLDFVTGQLDRRNHNWFTHPDELARPVLIDNGQSFSTVARLPKSAFVDRFKGKELSPSMLDMLVTLSGSLEMWRDLETLLDRRSVDLARKRVDILLAAGGIPDVVVAC